MREVLQEFFRPTTQDFERLWRESLITFDASSLLNLYGYSAETKNELVDAYDKFRERITLPYQFALEYSRNRAKVINKQISNFQKAERDLDALLSKHKVKQEQPYLSGTAVAAIETILQELADGKSKMEKSMASDESSDMLLQLFDGKIGPEPSPEELKILHDEAKARFAINIPPGFEDLKDKEEPECYGDYIAWKQIMAIAVEKKRDFMLVTDDVKEDWWHYEGSRLVGPLPALRKEFRTVTGQSIWLYSTEGFLRAAKEFAQVDVGESAFKEVAAARDTQRSERFVSLLKRTRAVVSDGSDSAKAASPEETKKATSRPEDSDVEEGES
ncbi:MAG TPA: PIN-like domain-containing protein [Bradyrhizobium sp.]|nr:PIN-like domain-containing protein [Bradyrhizobium sp.]